MIYLHIGGGVGDMDPSNNFRDGFSEFVKGNSDNRKKIYIIEANPINIKKLKKSWRKFNKVFIFNVAITHKDMGYMKFFFSEKDAPHYQLFSNKINHVKNHFPGSKIKTKKIKTIGINTFLKKNFNNKIINYFSIDIEGSDYEVMMNLDFKKFKIENISIEYLHLNKLQKKKLIKRLINYGYSYYGFGLDHNKIDWFFKKKVSKWNNFVTKFFPYIHRKHYKRLNRLLIK